MYSFSTRVGFSQTDLQRIMTIEAIVDSFQDCSCFQSEHLGVGFDYLEERDLVWILSSWQIEIKRYPVFFEPIQVETRPYDLKGFFGYRNFSMIDEKGERIVTANSVWTLMDLKRGCPAKLTEEMKQKYELDERLPMNYQSRKITLPQEDECDISRAEPIEIKVHHLDSNLHVNNAQYIRIALDCIENKRPSALRAEYRKQAHLGDKLVPVLYRKKECVTIALCDEAGAAYAVVEVDLC